MATGRQIRGKRGSMVRPAAPPSVQAPRVGLALAGLAFLLLFWMNQSIPLHEWEELKADVFVSGKASRFETLRYPLTFIYRRSADEELYFHLAGAVLGKAADRPLLTKAREGCGEAFQRPLPPSDGHFHAPYAEVPIEYPPIVLPFILAPRMLTDSLRYYCWALGAAMGACLLGAVAVLVRALLRAGDEPRGISRRIVIVGALFLAHGAISIQRLDAVTALFLALAAAAWMSRAYTRLGFWLGLAAASKFLPILLLLPIVAADLQLLPSALARARTDARRLARQAVARLVGVATLTFLAGLAPFFLFSRAALFEVLQYHGARGLHGESVLGSLWALAVIGQPAVHTYGSYNLSGRVPDFLAAVTMPLTLVALATFAAVMYRRPVSSPQRKGLVLLTALLLLWTTGKVFSPQYLTWGLPLLLLVPRGASGRIMVLYGGLVCVSQVYFRGYFDAVYNLEPLGVATLFLRDVVLLALLVVLGRTAMSATEATMAS
ncbi:MAG: hypothetical protein HOO96_43280 [Polyangiaceae bacterium]|nr:hypothetical protein [Polyangiaceae bacterium]